ncbi:YlxQ-related RNA-binding protein [Carnobacterium gallinarum]|uniref:YlxQ-related RNA-binding protein n=1 Tax=Carnobacterium gallinarum TaxID=2749 RepID=UPI0005580B12|nr:YlxQ-related RNA-binding protein [Carnobacterium gallinarum]
MTNEQKVLNLLGMAQRAGKLVTGEDLSIKEIRNGNAKLVIVALDASENTRKKLSDKGQHYEVPVTVRFTKLELSQAIGKERTICTIIDKGFAKKFRELLSI